MQGQTMRVFKWFWAWQDHMEEAWLESMSREGWHLAGVPFVGNYTFVKGEPRNDVYRLDYRAGRELPEYLDFVRGAGWEHIGHMAGWQYFRLPAEAGQTVELYTDPESKIGKYRRVLLTMALTSPALFLVFLDGFDRPVGWFNALFVAVCGASMALYVVATVKLFGRIRALRRL